MVLTCCIKHCHERQNRDTNISFHRFPRDPQLRENWIKAINFENFEPSANSRVCSKHFGNDCFVGTSLSSKRILIYGAIPCVSEEPRVAIEEVNIPSITTEDESASLNNEFANEDDNLKSAAPTDEENSSFQEVPCKKMRSSYIGDYLKSDTITDQKIFKDLVAKTLESKNKQIKALQRTNRKLLQQVEDLQELLVELRDNNVINYIL